MALSNFHHYLPPTSFPTLSPSFYFNVPFHSSIISLSAGHGLLSFFCLCSTWFIVIALQRKMYPDPHYLSERPCSQDQELCFPYTLDAYHSPLSSLPFSPSIFDHNLFFNGDNFQITTLDESALPPPSPAADAEKTVLAAPAAPAARKTPRRNNFRSDRHSKICTSKGLRDRRMRLSIGVSRQFFSLHDMLGFDKASDTVDWLLKQSKSAIERLTGHSSLSHEVLNSSRFVSESSASDCEGISIISEDNKSKHISAGSLKPKKHCRPGSVTFDPIITKESRVKARARARERTRGKKRIQCERVFSDTSKLDQLDPSEATGLEASSMR